jgi:LacI family transcriptional regulator
MSGPRTGVIDVLVPVIYDVYFSGILSGLADGAYDNGMRLLLSRSLADGSVLVLPEASSGELELVLRDDHPVVVIDPLLPLDAEIPCVTTANDSGAQEAVQHLLDLGHRRIGAITGPPGWVATDGRLAGYRRALESASLAFEPELVVAADFQYEPGLAAAASLLDLPERPTAVFAFNDSMALGVLRAARDRGLRVPEDVSIVGYDDQLYASVTRPTLTTVRQPLADMGRTAIDLVLRLLDGPGTGAVQIELPTRLVVRESTAPPAR